MVSVETLARKGYETLYSVLLRGTPWANDGNFDSIGPLAKQAWMRVADVLRDAAQANAVDLGKALGVFIDGTGLQRGSSCLKVTGPDGTEYHLCLKWLPHVDAEVSKLEGDG